MRRRDLLTQVLVVNLLLVTAAVVAAVLAANPNIDLGEKPQAGLVLGFAVAVSVAVNLYLLQRRFGPLERLVDEMERADLTRPGANLRGDAPTSPEEVVRLHRAFVHMLERLEAERRRGAGAARHAQEEERARVARDLHDEVNQSLTGLLLRLEAARGQAPIRLASELAEIRTVANRAMEELLALARQLRPTALDDLGLKAALAGHVSQLEHQSGIAAEFQSEGDVATLPRDVQTVVYRVAQEALSNAVHHSGAGRLNVNLARRDGVVELVVADVGRGFTFDQATRGLGLSGMRERALLVNGDLQVESRPDVGTRVRLLVPIEGVDDRYPSPRAN
ncbi:MAG: sensor histidine kinase [Solirubrobacterales bacterium]